MTAEWLLLATGFVCGWWVSRWWTEARRARFDMSRVWTGRKNYRKR